MAAVAALGVIDQLEDDAAFMDKYSRQIGAFGLEAMSKLMNLKVLIVGLRCGSCRDNKQVLARIVRGLRKHVLIFSSGRVNRSCSERYRIETHASHAPHCGGHDCCHTVVHY